MIEFICCLYRKLQKKRNWTLFVSSAWDHTWTAVIPVSLLGNLLCKAYSVFFLSSLKKHCIYCINLYIDIYKFYIVLSQFLLQFLVDWFITIKVFLFHFSTGFLHTERWEKSLVPLLHDRRPSTCDTLLQKYGHVLPFKSKLFSNTNLCSKIRACDNDSLSSSRKCTMLMRDCKVFKCIPAIVIYHDVLLQK